MNKNLIFSLFVSLLVLVAAYLSYNTMKGENISAATIGTPNPGHSWTEMECSGDSLCVDTTNSRVGIGTNNPTAKLDVNGIINLNSNRITSVGAPISSADAATKEYVDAAGGGYTSCYVIQTTNNSAACASEYTTLATSAGNGCGWIFNTGLFGSSCNGTAILNFAGGPVVTTFSFSGGCTIDQSACTSTAPGNVSNTCYESITLHQQTVSVNCYKTVAGQYGTSYSPLDSNITLCCK